MVSEISTSVGLAPSSTVVTVTTGTFTSGKFSRGMLMYAALPASTMPTHMTRTAMKCRMENWVTIKRKARNS